MSQLFRGCEIKKRGERRKRGKEEKEEKKRRKREEKGEEEGKRHVLMRFTGEKRNSERIRKECWIQLVKERERGRKESRVTTKRSEDCVLEA